MAIKSYCATHWGARELHDIEPEAALAEGATCSVCAEPADRAAGIEDPKPVVTRVAEGLIEVAFPTAKRPSKRP